MPFTSWCMYDGNDVWCSIRAKIKTIVHPAVAMSLTQDDTSISKPANDVINDGLTAATDWQSRRRLFSCVSIGEAND